MDKKCYNLSPWSILGASVTNRKKGFMMLTPVYRVWTNV